MLERRDVLAVIVDLARERVQVIALGVPSRPKVVMPDAVKVAVTIRVAVDESLGRVGRCRFEKMRFEIGDSLHSHIHNRVVAKHRGKSARIEKHPLQNRVGKDDVFVE